MNFHFYGNVVFGRFFAGAIRLDLYLAIYCLSYPGLRVEKNLLNFQRQVGGYGKSREVG